MWILFLFTSSIASLKFSNIQITRFLKVVMWVGIIQAIYMIGQRLGLDPWQQLSNDPNAAYTTSWKVSGTFTHPTFSGLFLAVVIPLTFLYKKFWAMILMFLGIISANSQVAYGVTVACSLLLIFWNCNHKQRFFIVINSVILTPIIIKLIWPFVNDSGRFETWRLIINDILHPQIIKFSAVLCGYGFGFYKYIFPTLHKSIFDYAHNDYLQFIFDVGIFPFILFSIIVFNFLKYIIFTLKDKECIFMAVILIGLFSSAFFTFTWQMEPFKFLGAIIIGILYSRNKVDSTT